MTLNQKFIIGVYGLLAILLFTVPFSLMHIKDLNLNKNHKRKNYLIIFLFLIYIFVLYQSSSTGTFWDYGVWGFNKDSVINLTLIENITDALKKILLFIPLGIFLPIFSDEDNLTLILVISSSVSIIIELSQMINPYTSTISDVVYSVIGVLIGYYIWTIIKNSFRLEYSSFRIDVNKDWVFPTALLFIAFASRFILFNRPAIAGLLTNI